MAYWVPSLDSLSWSTFFICHHQQWNSFSGISLATTRGLWQVVSNASISHPVTMSLIIGRLHTWKWGSSTEMCHIYGLHKWSHVTTGRKYLKIKKSCNSAHKRYHWLIYLRIASLDATPLYLHGPDLGRSQDMNLYIQSGIDESLTQHNVINGKNTAFTQTLRSLSERGVRKIST